jgi:hypothetical protein
MLWKFSECYSFIISRNIFIYFNWCFSSWRFCRSSREFLQLSLWIMGSWRHLTRLHLESIREIWMGVGLKGCEGWFLFARAEFERVRVNWKEKVGFIVREVCFSEGEEQRDFERRPQFRSDFAQKSREQPPSVRLDMSSVINFHWTKGW